MKERYVSIIMGSDSDLETMAEAAKILELFRIPFEMKILSAHRTPDQLEEYLLKIENRGVKVVICGAGAAAHLAGAVAARVQLPVIGVPLTGSPFNGLDALLSTVQMPGGVPVATVGVGKSGAINAGLLAVQILALSDQTLQNLISDYRDEQKKKVDLKNDKIKELYGNIFYSMLIGKE
jgi:phosphoribosylaminoimidazole carboxylase PurE protein